MGRDDLGDRAKRYELVSKTYLTRRTPVLARLDGISFSNFTRGFKKPFDEDLVEAMNAAAIELCKYVQGCKLAYVASDEISLLITDYENINTDAFFDYETGKLNSALAGVCVDAFKDKWMDLGRPKKRALFDCRVYNVPENDVTNIIYWRQEDWTKNSLTMLTSCFYSHKEMHGKRKADQHEMLHAKGVNWNDYPTSYKRGRCVIKGEGGWVVDNEIPIFKGEGREYVERFVRIPNG